MCCTKVCYSPPQVWQRYAKHSQTQKYLDDFEQVVPWAPLKRIMPSMEMSHFCRSLVHEKSKNLSNGMNTELGFSINSTRHSLDLGLCTPNGTVDTQRATHVHCSMWTVIQFWNTEARLRGQSTAISLPLTLPAAQGPSGGPRRGLWARAPWKLLRLRPT